MSAESRSDVYDAEIVSSDATPLPVVPKKVSDEVYQEVFEEHSLRVINSLKIDGLKVTSKSNSRDALILTKKEIDKIDDANELMRIMNQNIETLTGTSILANIIETPIQIIYGIFFNRLKTLVRKNNLGSVTQYMDENFPTISARRRQYYMFAAQILDIDIPGVEKYFPAGIYAIYQIMKIYKDKKYGITKNNFDPILNAFIVMDESFSPTETDYPRMARYYIFLERTLNEIVDNDLYYKLFKSGYNIRKIDEDNIKKIIKTDENKRLELTNIYIDNLLKYNHNTTKAYDATMGGTTKKNPTSSQQKTTNYEKLETSLSKIKQLLEDSPQKSLSYAEKNLAFAIIKDLIQRGGFNENDFFSVTK